MSLDISLKHPSVNIIVPLFNEEENFDHLTERLDAVIKKADFDIEIILVDDGSTDSTSNKMRELSNKNLKIHSIFLSRNFGHQIALTAGLKYTNATEAVLIIDGDLQDPPELLDEFYSKYKEGFDVVYAIRKERKRNFILKASYFLFYRIMKKFSYINIPLDSGDFSLLSRRVVDHINNMPEESRFLRGMRSWVGFKQVGLPYNREHRANGNSKYSIISLLSLAFNGIFNFSKYPMRFSTSIGMTAFSVAVIYFFITLLRKIFIGDVPLGFTALLFAIILFGGMQLIAIGIIGEYILRIFFQVKNRPLFIVKERIKNSEQVEPN
jgi:polyisoprenyl-phosphate glycosyltransferase